MTRRKAAPKKGSRRFRFIADTIAELKKVVWLSRREITYLTTIVLIVCVIVGLFLGAVDFGFTKFVDAVLIKG